MHERDLRALLLVRAIEETDTEGAVLPQGDRETATRETLRAARGEEVLRSDGTLTRAGERMLLDRARRLEPGLVTRHPALESLLASAPARHWSLHLLPLGGLVLGLALSALDESRRINILAFPLIGLVLWNLVAYAVLLAARLARGERSGPTPLAGSLLTRVRNRRFATLRARAGRIHAPLARALERFGREWQAIVMPLVVASGRRLMHLTAACVAGGLIVGMYVRGLVFRYEAGWESTFLGPQGVQMLLNAVYGPAAALTGIALPSSTAQILELEWSAASAGADAAPWIHLIAVTAAFYVVVPRLVLAGLATFERRRRERHAPVPTGLESYARRALGAAGGRASGLRTTVASYAYELEGDRREGLTRLVRAAFGPSSQVQLEPLLRYGDEDEYAEHLNADEAPLEGCLLGVMNLAATPEAENHGIVVTSWRDRITRARGTARLLFVVDEGPFLERYGSDPSLAPRLEERRELWRSFARACGVPALFTDLGRIGRAGAADPEAIAALNRALWPAESR